MCVYAKAKTGFFSFYKDLCMCKGKTNICCFSLFFPLSHIRLSYKIVVKKPREFFVKKLVETVVNVKAYLRGKVS